MTSPYDSHYLKFLPAVYQTTENTPVDPEFLTRFLMIFEVILGRAVDQLPDDSASGSGAPNTTVTQLPRKGTALLIDVLPDLFYPQLAPLFEQETEEGEFLPPFTPTTQELQGEQLTTYQGDILALLNSYIGVAPPSNTETWQAETELWLTEFLGWLSGWFALSPNQTWDIDKRRSALAGGLNMYRERGTAPGLQAVLEQEFDLDFDVVNDAVGTSLIVGQNTKLADAYSTGDPILGGIRPYSFVVKFYISTYDTTSKDVLTQKQLITKIVDANKPAHAQALIQPTPYPFILGTTSEVNVSTLLPMSPNNQESP